METLGGCRELVWAAAVGAPAAGGQAKPPHPALRPPPPSRPAALGDGRYRGCPVPFRRDPPVAPLGSLQLPKLPPTLIPRECPTSIPPLLRHPLSQAVCFRGKKKKAMLVMASILPLPAHPCLESAACFLQLRMYFSPSP